MVFHIGLLPEESISEKLTNHAMIYTAVVRACRSSDQLSKTKDTEMARSKKRKSRRSSQTKNTAAPKTNQPRQSNRNAAGQSGTVGQDYPSAGSTASAVPGDALTPAAANGISSSGSIPIPAGSSPSVSRRRRDNASGPVSKDSGFYGLTASEASAMDDFDDIPLDPSSLDLWFLQDTSALAPLPETGQEMAEKPDVSSEGRKDSGTSDYRAAVGEAAVGKTADSAPGKPSHWKSAAVAAMSSSPAANTPGREQTPSGPANPALTGTVAGTPISDYHEAGSIQTTTASSRNNVSSYRNPQASGQGTPASQRPQQAPGQDTPASQRPQQASGQGTPASYQAPQASGQGTPASYQAPQASARGGGFPHRKAGATPAEVGSSVLKQLPAKVHPSIPKQPLAKVGPSVPKHLPAYPRQIPAYSGPARAILTFIGIIFCLMVVMYFRARNAGAVPNLGLILPILENHQENVKLDGSPGENTNAEPAVDINANPDSTPEEVPAQDGQETINTEQTEQTDPALSDNSADQSADPQDSGINAENTDNVENMQDGSIQEAPTNNEGVEGQNYDNENTQNEGVNGETDGGGQYDEYYQEGNGYYDDDGRYYEDVDSQGQEGNEDEENYDEDEENYDENEEDEEW